MKAFIFAVMILGQWAYAENEETKKIAEDVHKNAINYCQDLSQLTVETFKNHPKRIKDFLEPNLLKNICYIYYRPEVQTCVLEHLNTISLRLKGPHTTEKTLQVNQEEAITLKACIEKAQLKVKNVLHEAAIDQNKSDELTKIAVEKLDTLKKQNKN
jgi:hypothetical protein